MACAAPAAILAFVVLLPFLKKAYTSDDVTFLQEARHVLIDPLHPTAFDLVDQGFRIRMSQLLVTGPVMAYLLVPCVLLGGPEWVPHLMQACFVVVTAIATAALALRLGLSRMQSFLAALLVVVSPAVIGMAGTAMPDVPAMALSVTGIERIVAWQQTRRWSAAIVAGLLLALAALSRPHVVLVFVCAAAWLILEERGDPNHSRTQARVFAKALAPIVLGLAFLAAVVYVTRDPASGDTTASATLRRIEPERVAFNSASFFLEWVVALPLGLLWPLLRRTRFLNPRRTLAAFAFAAVLMWFGRFVNPDWRWTLVTLFLVGHGVDVIADIVGQTWQRPEPTQLLLTMWLVIALAAAPYLQLPAKFLIPSAPAMAILIASEASTLEAQPVRWKLLGGVSVISLIVGLLIISTDAIWAEIGRRGGRVVAQEIAGKNKVWLDGSSGFQWYAMAAGAEPMATTPPGPEPGDIVVAGTNARLLRENYPKKTLLYRRVYAGAGGRVQGEHAGFFSNVKNGALPWMWGNAELGRIEVWRIDPEPAVLR